MSGSSADAAATGAVGPALHAAVGRRFSASFPDSDSRPFASASAHVCANLTAVVASVADGRAEVLALALVPWLTAADLLLLLLEPNLSAAGVPLSAPLACSLFADASTRLHEATLDALLSRLSSRDRKLSTLLSPEFQRALQSVASLNAEPRQSHAGSRQTESHSESDLLAAARDGDEERMIAILAAASLYPKRVIHRAAELRDLKALVSVVWKCGFSMRAGMAVQAIVGHVPPSELIPPATCGGYPLSREEMEWHLDLIAGHQAA